MYAALRLPSGWTPLGSDTLDDLPLFLTRGELAAVLRVTPRTVDRWARVGKLKRYGVQRHRLFSRDELREQGVLAPASLAPAPMAACSH